MIAVQERGGSANGAPTGDAVRAAAATVTGRAVELLLVADRLERVHATWVGGAAESASMQRADLVRAARHASDTWAQAADALRCCASVLDEADALRREARVLGDRAAAARLVAAGSGPAAAHAADDAAGLAAAATRCDAEADDIGAAATRRAAARLRELSARHDPVPHSRHRHHSQLYGLGHGAVTGLTQIAELGVRTSPQRAFMDPVGFLADERDIDLSLLHDALHPRRAAGELLGLGQLSRGDYGEWLGGLAAGAVIPGGRVGRLADRGGLVVLRPGARVPAGFPPVIKDLLPRRRLHILDGDATGGGHRAGTGTPGKTEFPAHWSDDQIIHRVMQTAMRPEEVVFQENGRYAALSMQHGVKVKVVLDPDGSVVTAHPTAGYPGVVHNEARPV